MVDLGRLGVLHVDGDVALAAAIDLAAGGGDAHAIGHLLLDELLMHHVHQALHHAGGVGAGNVAMQPALGVRDHRHRIAGAADREALGAQRVDQRAHLGLIGDHELHVGARGEAHVALGETVGDVAKLSDREHVHLALGAGAHRPDLVAALGDMMQHAGTRAVMPGPMRHSSSASADACTGKDRERRSRRDGAAQRRVFMQFSPEFSFLGRLAKDRPRRRLAPRGRAFSRPPRSGRPRAPCARSIWPPPRRNRRCGHSSTCADD